VVRDLTKDSDASNDIGIIGLALYDEVKPLAKLALGQFHFLTSVLHEQFLPLPYEISEVRHTNVFAAQ